ncbi:MAG: N-acetyltransferase [Elusimicrobia bacterium]|nr:N-acetyltransferase [Elusimicrobiota bacterium]
MKKIKYRDADVLIGYPSPRLKKRLPLRLGSGAYLRSGTVIYEGSRIGKNLETGHHVVIREQNSIGENFQIWNNSTMDYGCRIGKNVKVHCNVYIAQYTRLGDAVFLAPGVTIANDLYPGRKLSAKLMRGPVLEKGVQVGVNATILPYVRIGRGSLIGAGAVVTRNVGPHSVVVGNPGRLLAKTDSIGRQLKKKILYKLQS